MLKKFFGIISPEKGTPFLAAAYALIGFVFMILCFGRWIMPHAETDLAIPWAIVCMLLFLTGSYGFWAVTKGNLWHHRQFVSASWGFILMFLCWSIVYIAVEKNHVEKVNNGCLDRNKDWTYQQCDDRRKTAALSATILVTIGSLLAIYFTLVISRWISRLEWEEHLENERRLEQWRSGHGENPHIKRQFQIQGASEKEEV